MVTTQDTNHQLASAIRKIYVNTMEKMVWPDYTNEMVKETVFLSQPTWVWDDLENKLCPQLIEGEVLIVVGRDFGTISQNGKIVGKY